MRADRPIPGDPWPHDMTLAIDDRPNHLIELLWIREAHGLEPDDPDLPPLLTDTPDPAARALDDATRSAGQAAWGRLWDVTAAHAGREQDPALFTRLEHTADNSAERQSLLSEIVGLSWEDEFGRDVFDDPAYTAWERAGWERFIASLQSLDENSLERRDLDALVPAWRAGLTKIVTIPCRGEHTRRLNSHALLMTEGTRADSTNYRTALASFVRGQTPE